MHYGSRASTVPICAMSAQKLAWLPFGQSVTMSSTRTLWRWGIACYFFYLCMLNRRSQYSPVSFMTMVAGGAKVEWCQETRVQRTLQRRLRQGIRDADLSRRPSKLEAIHWPFSLYHGGAGHPDNTRGINVRFCTVYALGCLPLPHKFVSAKAKTGLCTGRFSLKPASLSDSYSWIYNVCFS
jgi:hypothetical protein